MERTDIITLAGRFIEESPNNLISEELALNPRCVDLKIFEAPIFAVGSPDDGLFKRLKDPDVIGGHVISPDEWLPGAKTVISFFLPFTSEIKKANTKDSQWPADEWLHGRYEGQQLLSMLLDYLVDTISDAGFETLAPAMDQRFRSGAGENKYTSNWSERHVAYICGLGTFGLSKGVITKRGISGRFGSILTELDLPKDSRDYSDIHGYCNMCGSCIARCPALAISFKNGKKSPLCLDFLQKVEAKHSPRYGCGKCQTSVPCESGAPR